MTLPRKPDHPDMRLMAEIVNQFDNAVDEEVDGEGKRRVYDMIANERVDAAAAAYLGMQRALRALDARAYGQMLAKMPDISAGTTLWMEGVLVGVELERRRQVKN